MRTHTSENKIHKDGGAYLQWLSISVIRDSNNQIVNYTSTFSDISEHMKIQERIRYMALHDALTGLPNRALLKNNWRAIYADQHQMTSRFVEHHGKQE